MKVNKNFLSQEEIDALLNSPELFDDNGEQEKQEEEASFQVESMESTVSHLTDLEMDALGEIGNISMGSAATALSQLLNQRVIITTPQVYITTPRELVNTFQTPFMVIDVTFLEGVKGSNLFILKVPDAAIIADLMMGKDGTNPELELTELHFSAVGEAMNQMMGSAATSMNTVFNKSVIISPPKITAVNYQQDPIDFPWDMDEDVVIVSFKMEIGTLLDSQLMQVIPIDIAKEEAEMLLGPSSEPKMEVSEANQVSVELDDENSIMSQEEINNILTGVDNIFGVDKEEQLSKEPQLSPEVAESVRNIDLILDVPLDISVILGKTKKPIKEVLNLIPGSLVELEKLADEPVEILVNGTLIAHGEVVVVNENFGIRITSIDSPTQRLTNLKS
ncbi:MAG: flagellar motor switch phosphatase FliY [Zhaonellaceae bacterium]|jgi:flagellar motor switch protein FliN/FliY